MSLERIPSEFNTFAEWFVDLDRNGRPSMDRLTEFALRQLDVQQRRRLADFLGECLDGTHTEDELVAIWKRNRPDFILHPIIPFFRRIRARLLTESGSGPS